MPSENQSADGHQRERFPRLVDAIGEDPARFLDAHLVESPPDHTDRTKLRMVWERIDGIDEVAVARAWLAVERNIDRGPRKKIVQYLENRIERLQEEGERADDEALHAIADAVRADHPEWDETDDVELASWAERVGIPSWDRTQPAATDGGEER